MGGDVFDGTSAAFPRGDGGVLPTAAGRGKPPLDELADVATEVPVVALAGPVGGGSTGLPTGTAEAAGEVPAGPVRNGDVDAPAEAVSASGFAVPGPWMVAPMALGGCAATVGGDPSAAVP